MPVEIKELHIRVTVDARPDGAAPGAAVAAGDAGDKDAIVAECAEQVLRIIEAKKER